MWPFFFGIPTEFLGVALLARYSSWLATGLVIRRAFRMTLRVAKDSWIMVDFHVSYNAAHTRSTRCDLGRVRREDELHASNYA